MVDRQEIIKNLYKLGLDKNESEIYYYLIIHGNTPVLEISRELRIPRTTVYRLCEKLVNLNVLEWVIVENSKNVKAINPSQLGVYIDNEEKRILEKRSALEQLVNIGDLKQMNPLETEVRYYKGTDGMKQLIWNTLKAKETILGYTPWGRDKITKNDFEVSYNFEAVKNDIQDMVLLNSSGLERFKRINNAPLSTIQRVRLLEISIPADVYIYNNIYAVNLWDQEEIVGVEIENPYIATFQKSVFKQLWEIAKPLSSLIKTNYTFVYNKDKEIKVGEGL